MKKVLLIVIIFFNLYGRENPFIPIIKNENPTIVKKEPFKSITTKLPTDARVLKSITFNYQSLDSSIKQKTIQINQPIDWHNPIIISQLQHKEKAFKLVVHFLTFYISKDKVLIETKDKLLREFVLIKPFRYVLDFEGNKNFLGYKRVTKTFIKKINVGNHNNFYRIVLYLDGVYKPKIKQVKKGYQIDFK